jgi:surfactin synthase thioesterase subunit
MIRTLPIVRADFTLIEQYRIEPQARISCPVTVFAGVDDPGAPPSAAAAWELRTSSTCRMVEFEAGHFFLDSHRAALAREIGRDLTAHVSRPWPVLLRLECGLTRSIHLAVPGDMS